MGGRGFKVKLSPAEREFRGTQGINDYKEKEGIMSELGRGALMGWL
jgi:hypothetical protein